MDRLNKIFNNIKKNDDDETMVYCFQRGFIGYDMTITPRYPP